MTDWTHDIYDKYDKYIKALAADLSDCNPDHNQSNRTRKAERYWNAAISVNIHETVRSTVKKNDRLFLENTQVDLTQQIKASKKVSIDQLLSALNNPNVCLLSKKSYVLKYVLDKKICTALREIFAHL